MDAYREGVVAGFSNAVSTFTSTVYPAIGIQIGNQKFQGMNIEFLLPSFYLTRENFNLSEMKRYTGFRISYQFPLGK